MELIKNVLGWCELYNGDCLAVMDALIAQGVKVDAIITDPPYGTTACKWDSVIPFDEMWVRLNQLIKPNGAIVLFGSEPFSSSLRMSNAQNFKYDWVWEKSTVTGHLNAKKMPMKAHETITVFNTNGNIYNPQKTSGHKRKVSTASHKRNSKVTDLYSSHHLTTYDSTERYPRSVLFFATDKQKIALHPTQKPVALMEYLINTYTHEGELVLDFTMGSASTGVACVNTNRRFIGIELDEQYYKISIERVQQAIDAKQNSLFSGLE